MEVNSIQLYLFNEATKKRFTFFNKASTVKNNATRTSAKRVTFYVCSLKIFT